MKISIHALREEGDDIIFKTWTAAGISIHALREEGDDEQTYVYQVLYDFYPRPPRGGRRAYSDNGITPDNISIHALREEGDHYNKLYIIDDACISIHALREEGDNLQIQKPNGRKDFYPRPPRGGRPTQRTMRHSAIRFLSTPSARRATAKTETKSLFSNKLYNILHEFRRALIYNGSKSYPNHAK